MTTALPPWLQIVWAVTAILIAFGAIAWALLILWPYLRETRLVMRESLKLGRATTSTLTTLESDIRPVVKDLKEIVSDIRTLIGDVKEQKPGRIIEFLDKLQKDGSIEKIATSVEAIARKAHEAIGHGKTKEGAEIQIPIFEKGDGFPDVMPCPFCGAMHLDPVANCKNRDIIHR